MDVYRSWETVRNEPGRGFTTDQAVSPARVGSPGDCSWSWSQADLYHSGSRTDPPRSTALPQFGHRSKHYLVASPLAEILASEGITPYLPRNDSSGLTDAWMGVPRHTHMAPDR